MSGSEDFNSQIKLLAEGKIRCQCGNDVWEMFLYVGAPPRDIMGGCKRCGAIFAYREADGSWAQQSGPVLPK